MHNQLIQLISIHFKEFFREPGIIFWALLFPICMAWGLGSAFSKKSELIRTVAFVKTNSDQQQNFSGSSLRFQDFLGDFKKNETVKKIGNDQLGITTYKFVLSSWEEAIQRLKRGEVSLVIETKNDSLNYHFDPLNPEAQLAYLQVSGTFSGQTIDSTIRNDKIIPLTQTGTRYIDFLIPGLMAMGIMMSCMWGISYSLIDKRMKKLLRRMIATPMKKSIFLFAQFVSRVTLSAVEASLLGLFAYFYYDIRLEGSFLALLLIFLAGNLAFTGIATLVSSRTANTQIGNGLINVVVFPMMVCSGIFFSYHNFPDWTINIIQKLPLTILADNIRSIFIEGTGVEAILKPVLILVSIGVITFLSGLKVYKWY